jgi:hypothetical protein
MMERSDTTRTSATDHRPQSCRAQKLEPKGVGLRFCTARTRLRLDSHVVEYPLNVGLIPNTGNYIIIRTYNTAGIGLLGVVGVWDYCFFFQSSVISFG